MGVWGQGQFRIDKGRPIVGRGNFFWTTAAIDAADGVHLCGELVPVGVGFGVGPIRVEGGAADRGERSCMDGEEMDKAVIVLCNLLGEGACWRTVATLVRSEVFEEHVLGASEHRRERGGGSVTAVIDGQRDDRIVNDIAAAHQKGADDGKAEKGAGERTLRHQKLLVKVISNPLEAGTARQTPPMQKMPSRRFPYPMESLCAPSMRPTVPYT